MTRVFVTGGTGVIGRALVGRLLARGDQVVGLARSAAGARALRERGTSVVCADALDEDALARGMEGCAVVFNVAGVNSLCVADPGPMQRVNVEGPVVAARAASRAGVRRVVHTSSAATIGEPPGELGDEQTVHRGWYLSTYERTKTEGERAVLAAARSLGLDVVCVNPSSVQGPGRAGGTGRFLLALLDGRLKVFIPTRVSMVDVADCVEGHLLAASRGVAGERYLVSGMTLTISEAFALATQVTGVKRDPWLLPRAVAPLGGTVVEQAFRIAHRPPPVCREMVRTLLHGHRYDGSRAERELGLRYTDPRETLRRTLEWARSEGLLRTA